MTNVGDAWPGTPEPLWVTPSDSGVNVAVRCEGASAVQFVVIEGDREKSWSLVERTGPVFHGFVPGVTPGATYGLRVDGPWDPARGLRFNPHKLLLDPYARAITGGLSDPDRVLGHLRDDPTARDTTDSAGAVPLSVVVLDDFDWQGDRAPRIPWQDTIVYEAHVKGLTELHPEIPQALRGTYGGVSHPAMIDHMYSIGVTAIELLPVHHFVSELELIRRGMVNYWGYNSIGYFAPHAGYASGLGRGDQVTEFKTMVRELHAAGIEVILDVVYNHTAEGGSGGPTLCFKGLDNPGYYRLDGFDYVDYTGTGNTLNVPRPHTLRLIMDSLRYWVTDMHVDGFRFDLASTLARSLHDVDMLGTFMTSLEQDPVLREVKLIAEPWDIGAGGYQVGEFPALWREWNDKFRDTVRDYWRGEPGLRQIGWRLAGSADLYQDDGRHPQASVNFVTAHDGFTLRDLVTYQDKHNEANGEDNRDGSNDNRSFNHGVEGETARPDVLQARRRQLRNLLTTLFLSAGVPMLVAGDEFGRTQRGNNNAYCQDNEISWVDWGLHPWQEDLLSFTRSLARLREAHPVFRQRTFFTGQAQAPGQPGDLVWVMTAGREFTEDDWADASAHAIGMFRYGRLRAPGPHGEPVVDDSMLLLLNSGVASTEFVLPDFAEQFVVELDTSRPDGPRTKYRPGARVALAGRSTMLLSAAV